VSLPLAFEVPAIARATNGVLDAIVGGERVALDAERALHWPRQRTVFVADVHLGKAAAFRAGGVPLPRGSTAADLARLTRIIERSSATRLIVLGDFLHAKAGRVAALADAFIAWRSRHSTIDVVLVRGNHDARAGDPPPDWNVRCVDEPYALPPFLACHMTISPPSGYALCGHLHPGVRIHGSGGETARLPCFVIGNRRAILPAFGRFTGLAEFERDSRETIVVVAGGALFTLPPAVDDSVVKLQRGCPFVGRRIIRPRCGQTGGYAVHGSVIVGKSTGSGLFLRRFSSAALWSK
jgi:DNA ligase-associated metallophosphoesterase